MDGETRDPEFESGRLGKPIRDLGLQIAGTPLEALIQRLQDELTRAGLTRVRPRFYLSTEWGVNTGTVAVAIPFYLASPALTEMHAQRAGWVEGIDEQDILRYLRHEVGHVVNYAYRLFEREDWIRAFGPITRPYLEEYRPVPFSARFVRHLPGWYAQKHPDEDWSETFAVWLTPGFDWRQEYAIWPEALAKLKLCDAIIQEVRAQDPPVTADDPDEDITTIPYSLEQYYRQLDTYEPELPPGVGGALSAIFDVGKEKSASALIKSLDNTIAREVYQWTGLFPERARAMLSAMAKEADRLQLSYRPEKERAVAVALTVFATSLAMSFVLDHAHMSRSVE
jgi:hypothetical protein